MTRIAPSVIGTSLPRSLLEANLLYITSRASPGSFQLRINLTYLKEEERKSKENEMETSNREASLPNSHSSFFFDVKEEVVEQTIQLSVLRRTCYSTSMIGQRIDRMYDDFIRFPGERNDNAIKDRSSLRHGRRLVEDLTSIMLSPIYIYIYIVLMSSFYGPEITAIIVTNV